MCHYQIDLVQKKDAYHTPSSWMNANRDLFHYYQLRINRDRQPYSDVCRRDINDDQIVTGLTKVLSFTERRAHRVWLLGQHFLALLTFQPNQYDPTQVIFRSEIIKLYRIIKDANNNNKRGVFFNVRTKDGQLRKMSVEKDDRILEDVYSFAVQPRGMVFVFFERTHCVIGFYSLDVSTPLLCALIYVLKYIYFLYLIISHPMIKVANFIVFISANHG